MAEIPHLLSAQRAGCAEVSAAALATSCQVGEATARAVRQALPGPSGGEGGAVGAALLAEETLLAVGHS